VDLVDRLRRAPSRRHGRVRALAVGRVTGSGDSSRPALSVDEVEEPTPKVVSSRIETDN
jgi:hypothetical protein